MMWFVIMWVWTIQLQSHPPGQGSTVTTPDEYVERLNQRRYDRLNRNYDRRNR